MIFSISCRVHLGSPRLIWVRDTIIWGSERRMWRRQNFELVMVIMSLRWWSLGSPMHLQHLWIWWIEYACWCSIDQSLFSLIIFWSTPRIGSNMRSTFESYMDCRGGRGFMPISTSASSGDERYSSWDISLIIMVFWSIWSRLRRLCSGRSWSPPRRSGIFWG